VKLIECGSNLGDFILSLPVLSGLFKQYGKLSLVLKSDNKVNVLGLKELLLYQDIFDNVLFDFEEKNLKGYHFFCSGLSKESSNTQFRPLETCKFENFFRNNYNFKFEVDDNFKLKVPLEGKKEEKYICGDRWHKANDRRRDVEILKKFSFLKFLDFDKPILENASLIKNSDKPFITTFTGIAVLANLMYKDTIIIYDNGVKNWNGWTFEKTCQSAFYLNRNIKFIHIDNFNESCLL